MIDAIIFPVPALFLQIPLSLLNPSSALWLATVGFIGCLLGTPVGYWIGKTLGDKVLYKWLKKSWVDSATGMFQKNGEAAILIGSFTPIPFKVFTILSGALHFPLWRLMLYAAVGRAAKFYVVGALFYFYGQAAEHMVGDVSKYMLLIGVPLVALFLFLRARSRKKRAAKEAEAAETAESIPASTGESAMEQAKTTPLPLSKDEPFRQEA